MRRQIGVLAVQGNFECHKGHIESLDANYIEVRDEDALAKVDALILCGGESGVMSKLLEHLKLTDALARFFAQKPAWGICAGAILLSNGTNPRGFGAIDIDVQRNAYGRQLDSFETRILQSDVSFIRAPKITRVGLGVKVLHSIEGSVVWAERGNVMVSTFHPELSRKYPSPFHEYFLNKVVLSPG